MPVKFSRRHFIKVSTSAIAGLITTPFIRLLANNELNHPVVRTIQVPIRNLPEAFEGFRIVAMTDFHILPYTRPELILKSIELANQLKPDLGVFLGDYVWQHEEAIFELGSILAGLDAKHGIYSVIGNHDIWADVDLVKKGLNEARIPILINQGLEITRGADSINLVGLDDGWSGNADLDMAYQSLRTDRPTIMLLHEPDLADHYAHDPRVSLMLAGHTHGGQVRFNGKPIIAPHLGKKYNQGLYRVGGLWLYTSPGIGVISVPIRYNCPPEVSEIILVNGDSL
ncbi:MAG: metallophosphoesterase [Anaerolineales bacterium]